MAKNNTTLYLIAAAAAIYIFRKQLGIGGSGDFEAADELVLYIDNSSNLYRSRRVPIQRNLIKKIKSGKYNPVLAEKSFLTLAREGAKEYHRQFGTPGTRYSSVFNLGTLKMAAAAMQRDFYNNWKDYDY
jgi:hypothetical protein